MKKTAKKVTLQTLDKKIDTLGQTFDKKIDTLGQTFDKKIDTLGQTFDKKLNALTDVVDALARSTKQGFDAAQEFQKDMTEFANKTGVTLFNLDSHARTTNERLDSIEKTLGPIVHLPGVVQRELREHDRRLSLIEKKIGIA